MRGFAELTMFPDPSLGGPGPRAFLNSLVAGQNEEAAKQAVAGYNKPWNNVKL
jgi:hypothetical protein